MLRQSYHILSDLHLEHRPKISSLTQFAKVYGQLGRKGYNSEDPGHKQKNLILAGDIGYPGDANYWSFLKDCATKYKNVICVAGNHEYYDEKYNISQTNDIIKEKSKEINDVTGNFHYLLNETVVIDGVKYIGTTLWSRLNPKYKREIVGQLNDFNYIQMKFGKNLTFDQYIELHIRDLEWLQGELHQTELNGESNFVIITHHLLSEQLVHPQYKDSLINSAFYSNLDHIIKGKLYVCGHTHKQVIKTINSTDVVVNPFGYASECLYSHIVEKTIDFD
jgi:predicted phosphodiesterase